MYVNVYPRHDGCGSIGVSSQHFVQLVQLLQYRSLVLVLPQAPGSDQPAVVIQRTAEPGGGHTALHLHRRRRLASRHRVTWQTSHRKQKKVRHFIVSRFKSQSCDYKGEQILEGN